jgi:uncharacterized membrane protein
VHARCWRHRRLLGGSRGYSTAVVETVLGLIGMVIFIVGVISLAAGITWLVVRITPSVPRKKRKQPEPAES